MKERKKHPEKRSKKEIKDTNAQKHLNRLDKLAKRKPLVKEKVLKTKAAEKLKIKLKVEKEIAQYPKEKALEIKRYQEHKAKIKALAAKKVSLEEKIKETVKK